MIDPCPWTLPTDYCIDIDGLMVTQTVTITMNYCCCPGGMSIFIAVAGYIE